MSKEYLEALEEIRDFRYGKDKLLVCQTEMYKTIKQALQRLEAIENAKPSEALEELDYIGKNCYEEAGNAEEDCILYAKDYIGFNTIKQALLRLDSLDDAMDLLPNHFSCIKNREIIVMRTETYEEYLKQEKALKIIAEKGLPLGEIDMIKQSANYNEYNIKFSWANFKNISIQKTEKEFELLKRWLG